MYLILFYDLVEDYVERRASLRAEHLELAHASRDRGELQLAGALDDPVDGAVLVFKADDARAGLTSDGAVLHHEAYRAKDKGRVEVWPSVKPDDVPEVDAWELPPIDVAPKDSPVAQLARRVAAEIKQWIGRERLPGHENAVKAGDIMILLPRREPFGSAIIRELKLRGVPVAGADRITLSEQIAVMDLIALGRFVLLPEDGSESPVNVTSLNVFVPASIQT